MSSQDQETGDEGHYMPPSKRPRVLSKACEACKQRKSKCDSSRPRCGACCRAGETLHCIYREKAQPGLRPGYGKAIEHRMSILEGNMARISDSVQQVLQHIRPDTVPMPAPVVPSEPMQSADEGVPSTAITEETQFWGPSQQLSEMPSFSPPAPIEQLPSPAFTMPASQILDDSLPTDQVLRELVDLFFQHVHPAMPMFHKPGFIANMFTPDRSILLHSIIVVTFRFWRKPSPTADAREAYVTASREKILLSTVDTSSLVSTQALALLALDAIGQGPGPRTLNIMAMLMSAAYQLRLSRASSRTNVEKSTSLVRNEDSDDDLDTSIIITEERRRLFWVIYSLDRLSSVSHGHSTAIETKTIKLPYPAKDEQWGQVTVPEWFQPISSIKSPRTQCSTNLWHHYIDMLELLDRSNQLLIQPVNLSLPAHCQEWQSNFRRLDIMLSTWHENLPREILQSPSPFSPIWVLVHAIFHLISMRMYTVAAFPSTTSPYLPSSQSARGRLRQAIRNVASMASSREPAQLDQLGPFFAFVVWVAARGLIILWTTGYENTYGSTPIDLEALINALKHLSFAWPCAQSYSDMIQLILDTKNNPGGSAGLEIFNDTRRTSYGLKNRLAGSSALHPSADPFSHAFDFLDMPILDMGDFGPPRGGIFSNDGDWL